MLYSPALDGLRAFSIIAVLLYHFNENLLPGGWAGVDVFFVLSGFLITRILKAEIQKNNSIDLLRFYYFRILRLVPAFAVLMVFIAALAAVSKTNGYDHIRAAVLASVYLMNWNRAFEWYPSGVLGHTWSLAIEEQFYLIWPTLFIFLHKKRPVAVLISFYLAVLAWRFYCIGTGSSIERTYNGFDTHCDGLLLGCILGFSSLEKISAVASRTIVVPLLGLFAIFTLLPYHDIHSQTLGLFLSAIFSGWLICALQQKTLTSTFFSSKWMAYTGRISYGLYLWHYPIMVIAKSKFTPATNIGNIAFGIALVGMSFFVAALSFKFIESPILRLKNRYPKKAPSKTEPVKSPQTVR